MRILFVLVIAMLLWTAGCSSPTYYWYHPDRSLEEAEADYTACQEKARHQAADMIGGQHYDRIPPGGSVDKTGSSTTNTGETQDAWRDQYEQSVIAGSMKEKGYLKLSSDHIPHGAHTKKFDEGAVAGQ
jgi:hypothetical protein